MAKEFVCFDRQHANGCTRPHDLQKMTSRTLSRHFQHSKLPLAQPELADAAGAAASPPVAPELLLPALQCPQQPEGLPQPDEK
jgi:hypothetical protein